MLDLSWTRNEAEFPHRKSGRVETIAIAEALTGI
jgi:hypothetical protein